MNPMEWDPTCDICDTSSSAYIHPTWSIKSSTSLAASHGCAAAKCEGKVMGDILKQFIDQVIFNAPATIIKWKDGTKTVVKCRQGDTYDKEVGFMMRIMKYLCGNQSNATKRFIAEYCGETEKTDSINSADNDDMDYEQEERRLTRDCQIKCEACRISRYNNSRRLLCPDFKAQYPNKYKQIICQWVKDCPANKEGTD